jgi:hypothetical protein
MGIGALTRAIITELEARGKRVESISISDNEHNPDLPVDTFSIDMQYRGMAKMSDPVVVTAEMIDASKLVDIVDVIDRVYIAGIQGE